MTASLADRLLEAVMPARVHTAVVVRAVYQESPYHPAKKQRLGSRPGNEGRVAAGLPGLAARGRPGRLGVLRRGLLFGGRCAGGDQGRVLRG